MINYLFQEKNWQSQLNDLITDPEELLSIVKLNAKDLHSDAILANQQFKLRVPRQFVDKIQLNNPFDPLLLQIFPHHLEMQEIIGFSTDPLGEKDANATSGIIHKYKSRLLLTLTGACAIHCRYCFRRHFPYQENLPKEKTWQTIKQYIMSHPDINEIILSGGDPLSLSNEKLERWITHFEELDHQIKTLRIHTRLPVVIPERIDDQLLKIFKNSSLKILMVVHANHTNELDLKFDHAIQSLTNQKIMVMNQSVLLKGINNDAAVLTALSYRLFDAYVIPYYLHVLDKVNGAAHFLITDEEAQNIYQQILKELPGYLVPKLVREIRGELHKTPLNVL